MVTKLMPARGLTPEQRTVYDELRERVRITLARYSKGGPGQRVLAEAAGVTQSTISRVLLGRVQSLRTLEAMVTVLLASGVADDDRKALRTALARALALLRDHEPPKGRAR
jgi:transcriptional regulator with XRE-family HTH domain